MNAVAQWIAYLVILFMAVGNTVLYRTFAKVKVGPLYMMEACFLVWALFAFLSEPRWILGHLRTLRGAALFFAWGAVLLLVDVAAGAGALPWMRVAQHSLLFMYPLMWMSVGLWLGSIGGRRLAWLIGLVAVLNALPNFLGMNVHNISLGPLLALATVMAYREAIDSERGKLARWAFALVLTFFTFLPFWKMWFGTTQRTSLILLMFILAVTPFFMPFRTARMRNAFKTAAILFAIFWAGSGVTVTTNMLEKGELEGLPVHGIYVKLRNWILIALYHSEDLTWEMQQKLKTNQLIDEVPKARFRIYLWERAIEDWKQAPILGLRFVPEVPSLLYGDIPNNGNFEYQGAPPVAGPHNSYLTILARMGVIGLGIFLWFAWGWWKAIRWPRASPSGRWAFFSSLFLFFVPLNGAIHAFFNVGLESPFASALMWVFAGVAASISVYRKPVN